MTPSFQGYPKKLVALIWCLVLDALASHLSSRQILPTHVKYLLFRSARASCTTSGCCTRPYALKIWTPIYRHTCLMKHQETHQTDPVKSCTAQYSLVPPSTVQYCPVHSSTAQYSLVPCSNVFKSVQMCSNMFKLFQNLFKCHQSCSNGFKLVKNLSNVFKWVQIVQNLFKCYHKCSNGFKLVQNLFK